MDREKVISEIEEEIRLGEFWDDDYRMIDLQLLKDVLILMKEQEESIPVSWLKEKLEGHPELPYAVTDGINNVLNLWEGR